MGTSSKHQTCSSYGLVTWRWVFVNVKYFRVRSIFPGHDLLMQLLTYNPDKRISARAALKHGYLANVCATTPPSCWGRCQGRQEGGLKNIYQSLLSGDTIREAKRRKVDPIETVDIAWDLGWLLASLIVENYFSDGPTFLICCFILFLYLTELYQF